MPIAILGLGKTGLSLARYFRLRGEEVWGIDDNANLASPSAKEYCSRIFLGGELPPSRDLSRFFISPGIAPRHPVATAARAQGLKVEGELDLAFSLCRGEVIAITGTNGKSTTVSLLGAMYAAAGISTAVGGNLGTPFLDLVEDKRNFSKFVVEVSSYQLETTEKFRPHVAALLNITEDHLDRYANLSEYAAAKAKLFAFQTPRDFAVFNDDDLQVLKVVEGIQAKSIPISITKPVHGAYARSQKILWTPQARVESSFDLSRSQLRGLHNLENISAAVACAKVDGLEDEPIQEAINNFSGLPHRVEWVAQVEGVDYYDDSKGTNVGAVVMSLAGFEKEVILILGGKDKGGDYAPLQPLIKNKCRAVVVMGEAKEKIMASLKGSAELVEVNSMKEAVAAAQRLARPGGTVLLSPACSSFDMFVDYHDRGAQFQKCVRELHGT